MAWRKSQERSKHHCPRARHPRNSYAAKRLSLIRASELATLVTEHWKCQASGRSVMSRRGGFQASHGFPG
jgi:hypothetical protein